MSELRKAKRRLDHTEVGGAPLLGVEGIVYVGHGRSNARATFNAVRAARDAVQSGVLEVMREVGRAIPARPGRGEPADDVDGAAG
jgi:glycerol-3-phosphate acyltransferase PlsX